jgi:hypothetical protein
MMANFIGLYYPYIHFKDEAWLKTIALYWDGVKRIVPSGYPLNDSETVKTLSGELGLIENVRPSPDEWPVRDSFVQFLLSNAAELRGRYGVEHREKWEEDPITAKWAPDSSDKRLAYLHNEKIWEPLKNALVDIGLAEVGRTGDGKWIGMHPKIADIYMTALAEHMTTGRGWYPITDEALDQLAVSGFSMERLSRALLDNEHLVGNVPTKQEMRVALANLCLETVIPKDVGNVPVERIIKLRKEHQAELVAFQDYLAAFRTEANKLTEVTDRAAFAEHLKFHYTKTMEPSLKEVRKAFKLMKVESATSIVNVNFALPAMVTTVATALGLAVNPIVGGIGAFAFGVVPIIQKRQDEAQAALKKPGAWLLRVEEGLKPENFMSWVRDGARKFVLGV